MAVTDTHHLVRLLAAPVALMIRRWRPSFVIPGG